MALKVRDFIYLDIDRLKSIIAQLEHGLVDTSSESNSGAKEVEVAAEGTLFGLIKALGGTKFLWQRQQSETKTLHDNIYNRVEEVLLDNDMIVHIPDNLSSTEIMSQKHADLLNDTSFILARGRVDVNDYSNMKLFLENFNDLGSFLAYAATQSLPDTMSQKARQDYMRQQKQSLTLDKAMVKGFQLVFDMFYKDRVVIKMMPFTDFSDFRLVGNLQKELLRDDIASITYKYGTSPVANWIMFGQVASIPPKDRVVNKSKMTGGQLELAMQNLFDVYRDIELLAQSVVYPEIAITPIAVYRE